jgi:TonB-dependent SusC/RagA subfamily outer membrane receptor
MSSPRPLTRLALCAAALLSTAGCHHRAPGTVSDFSAGRLAAPALATASAPGTESVHPAEARAATTTRIEDLLVGRFAGLDVQRISPAHLSVRFRGAEPLIVVDGLEADAGVLATLQPRSVVRIDLLKDPAATGVYGNRGANGVLVVTTRQGGR